MRLLILITFALLIGCSTSHQGWRSFGAGDYEKAYQQFLEGAKRGEAASITGLAVLADPDKVEGQGLVKKSYSESKALYIEAIKRGEPTAMNNLGLRYIQRGKPVEGAELLYVAARWNSQAAIENLQAYGLPVPEPDLYTQQELREALTVLSIGIVANNMGSPESPGGSSGYQPESKSIFNNANCSSDIQCKNGVCVKKMGSYKGICMKTVDQFGSPTIPDKEGGVNLRDYGSEKCDYDVDCPADFMCHPTYNVCVEK